MANPREEEIWDEAYLYGLTMGRQAGLEIAQKQLEKVFKEAYDILNVEMRINRENEKRTKYSHYLDLHDPYRGLADGK